MTIDVALLRELAAQPNTKVRKDFTELAMQSIGMVLLKPTTVTELLDAYEERDRLREVLMRIRDKPGISARDHARLALEGRE